MHEVICPHCNQPVPQNLPVCPHCGIQVGFPNVTAANSPEETAVLDGRLQKTRDDLRASNAETVAQEFLDALTAAEAVINRYFGELFRLAWSDNQVYATYYQKVGAGFQFPETDRWNRLRAIADTILFGDLNKQQIRFAALSLTGQGLSNYGDCSLVLKRGAIAHRATVFEENSAAFMSRHNVNAANDFAVPRGYRAAWDRRCDLCLCKLGKQLTPGMSPDEFASLLLHSGATSDSDEFVEVHIWGPVTIRSFEKVIVHHWATPPSSAQKLEVSTRLHNLGIEFVTP